ncbi:hypothetical protein Hanom_Chr01g00014161 [Helianthus anomalus]
MKPQGPRCKRFEIWTKVTKLTKPQGLKWQFTLFLKISIYKHTTLYSFLSLSKTKVTSNTQLAMSIWYRVLVSNWYRTGYIRYRYLVFPFFGTGIYG